MSDGQYVVHPTSLFSGVQLVLFELPIIYFHKVRVRLRPYEFKYKVMDTLGTFYFARL